MLIFETYKKKRNYFTLLKLKKCGQPMAIRT